MMMMSPSCFKAAADAIINRRSLPFKLGMVSAIRQCAQIVIGLVANYGNGMPLRNGIFSFPRRTRVPVVILVSTLHGSISFISRHVFDVLSVL